MFLQGAYASLSLAFGILCFIFGMSFLLLRVPQNKLLKNYCTMRKAIAFAYVIVGLSLFVKLAAQGQTPNLGMALFTTLIIASFQSCLFTYALITLIDIQFVTKKKLFLELGIIFAFSIALVLSYISGNQNTFRWIFRIFTFYYLLQLIRYTHLFITSFRKYKNLMENYFSEQESNHLQWVVYAFFSALGIGILALIMLFAPFWVYICVQIIMIAFYFFFGVRFINYAFRFQYIEEAISPVTETESEGTSIPAISYYEVEKAVMKWVKKKGFTEGGVTIERMATQLGTNRTYLSNYINSAKGKTFKSWINELRIEEAKHILLEKPEFSVGEVSQKIGYSEQSNFSRQFSIQTGMTPSEWRKKKKNP